MSFRVERLKLPEGQKVIEEVLEIIATGELEDVNAGRFSAMSKRGMSIS